jgi:dTDP-4-amino-4,6-dideoxygalactose transaminase
MVKNLAMTSANIPFVEPKEPDWANIARLCAPSSQAMRWTNFGPLSDLFAAEVAKIANLGEDRVAIPASSATTALHAVVGMHEVLAGRPLVWLVSAYGFFSTAIGPLADRIKVIDCDRSGMLDLKHVAALAPDSWDGLILTDIFGFKLGLSSYQDFCSVKDKPLVIDAATSFSPSSTGGNKFSEVVSFHHTKPWGFGEGGCAIVERDQAELVRSFLSYGRDIDAKFARFATNGKMSDVAAAVILDRLSRMPVWSRGYHLQRERMFDLAATAGIESLGTPAPEVVSPHVPLLAPRPIAAEALPKRRFSLGKYYQPLSAHCPVAADIYSRIVNLPCHPMMADVSDAEILDCLHEICRAV